MQERCKIGVVIGNANSPHAINIMKGIDQASKECDVQIMYFMNVSSPYTAHLIHPQDGIIKKVQFMIMRDTSKQMS